MAISCHVEYYPYIPGWLLFTSKHGTMKPSLLIMSSVSRRSTHGREQQSLLTSPRHRGGSYLLARCRIVRVPWRRVPVVSRDPCFTCICNRYKKTRFSQVCSRLVTVISVTCRPSSCVTIYKGGGSRATTVIQPVTMMENVPPCSISLAVYSRAF